MDVIFSTVGQHPADMKDWTQWDSSTRSRSLRTDSSGMQTIEQKCEARGDGDGHPARYCRICGRMCSQRLMRDTCAPDFRFTSSRGEVTYAQLISDCYQIKLSYPTDAAICSTCVYRLTEAQYFKDQVCEAFKINPAETENSSNHDSTNTRLSRKVSERRSPTPPSTPRFIQREDPFEKPIECYSNKEILEILNNKLQRNDKRRKTKEVSKEHSRIGNKITPEVNQKETKPVQKNTLAKCLHCGIEILNKKLHDKRYKPEVVKAHSRIDKKIKPEAKQKETKPILKNTLAKCLHCGIELLNKKFLIDKRHKPEVVKAHSRIDKKIKPETKQKESKPVLKKTIAKCMHCGHKYPMAFWSNTAVPQYICARCKLKMTSETAKLKDCSPSGHLLQPSYVKHQMDELPKLHLKGKMRSRTSTVHKERLSSKIPRDPRKPSLRDYRKAVCSVCVDLREELEVSHYFRENDKKFHTIYENNHESICDSCGKKDRCHKTVLGKPILRRKKRSL